MMLRDGYRRRSAICYAVFVAIGFSFSWMSASLRMGSAILPGPAIIPLVVSLGLLLVSGGLLLRLLVWGEEGTSAGDADEELSLAPDWVAGVVWLGLLVYPLTVPYLGHILSMSLTGVIVQSVLNISWTKGVLAAVSSAVVSDYVFVKYLQLPLPVSSLFG